MRCPVAALILSSGIWPPTVRRQKQDRLHCHPWPSAALTVDHLRMFLQRRDWNPSAAWPRFFLLSARFPGWQHIWNWVALRSASVSCCLLLDHILRAMTCVGATQLRNPTARSLGSIHTLSTGGAEHAGSFAHLGSTRGFRVFGELKCRAGEV